MEEIDTEIRKFVTKYPHVKMLLKKGEYGSAIYYMDSDYTIKQIDEPAYKFEDFPDLKLVDSTAAGDCFTGAFALKMLDSADYSDENLQSVLKFANKVGFLCITKFGAVPSIPTMEDVKRVFKVTE